MPRKFHKYRLLLDENFPPKSYFHRLNSRHNLKHIVTDFKEASLKDRDVYLLAAKEKRLVITFNDKHFKEFAQGNKKSGVIGVSTNLPIDQIDKKLTSLLNRSKPSDLYGRFVFISGETKVEAD